MRTYAAISSKLIEIGSYNQCVMWADNLVQNDKAKIVKIVKCRPLERHCPIISEITKEGMRAIPNGRVIELSLIKRAYKNASN